MFCLIGEGYGNLELSVDLQSQEQETKFFSMTENTAYGETHVTVSSSQDGSDGFQTSKDGDW